MQVEYQVMVAEKRGEADYADVLREMASAPKSDNPAKEQAVSETSPESKADELAKLSYFLASASLMIQNLQNQLRA